MRILTQDFNKFDNRFRANFFNTLTGFKSANLIGTINEKGVENLAIFNSVIHLGANPPLMGFILRPTTVERHTYENILNTKFYTINHIHQDMIESAHQTSAKYSKEVSEFEATGLNSFYNDDFKAPFVKESLIKIGLKYKTSYLIKENDTRLVVGEVQQIQLPEELMTEDGSINLEAAHTVAISGLDTYFSCAKIKKLSYARP